MHTPRPPHLESDLLLRRETAQRRAQQNQGHGHEPLVAVDYPALIVQTACKPRQEPGTAIRQGVEGQINGPPATHSIRISTVGSIRKRVRLTQERLVPRDLVGMNTRRPCCGQHKQAMRIVSSHATIRIDTQNRCSVRDSRQTTTVDGSEYRSRIPHLHHGFHPPAPEEQRASFNPPHTKRAHTPAITQAALLNLISYRPGDTYSNPPRHMPTATSRHTIDTLYIPAYNNQIPPTQIDRSQTGAIQYPQGNLTKHTHRHPPTHRNPGTKYHRREFDPTAIKYPPAPSRDQIPPRVLAQPRAAQIPPAYKYPPICTIIIHL